MIKREDDGGTKTWTVEYGADVFQVTVTKSSVRVPNGKPSTAQGSFYVDAVLGEMQRVLDEVRAEAKTRGIEVL